MKKSFIIVLTVLFAIGELGVFLGFSNSDNPNRISKTNLTSKNKSTPIVTDNNNNNSISTGLDYYSDDFNAPNDTAALKARGYLVYRNGTFTGSVPPNFWFTGFPPPSFFPAFNGADSDYVASISTSAGGLGNIDNWLVLPDLDVEANDSICFYSRSLIFFGKPDSIRVMFNPLGGILPSSPGWIELGRFRVNTGFWQLRSFVIPSSALSARLAIRYSVVNGGVGGPNSAYIGIDALRVQGAGVLPVELASFVSVITNNYVILNWSTATETNNSGFDIERSTVNRQLSMFNVKWLKIGNVDGNGTTTFPMNYSFTDRGLNTGIYNYRLKQIDFNGNFKYFNLSNEVEIGIPNRFELSQNYPNPFNPSTIINYQLSSAPGGFSNVKLSVYDISGKEVRSLVNEKQDAGYYSVEFNASSAIGGLSSGIYFYKLVVSQSNPISSGDFSSVKKMMLVK